MTAKVSFSPISQSVPTTQNASETDLRSLLNDNAWRQAMVDKYAAKVHAAVQKRLRKHPNVGGQFSASDVVQTTFRQFFKGVEEMKEPLRSEEAFLFKTMYFKLNDYLDRVLAGSRNPQKEVRGDAVLRSLMSREQTPSSVAGDKEELESQRVKLERGLKELKPKDRELLTGFLDGSIDLDQWAREHQIERTSVDKQLWRIGKRLKSIINAES